MRKHEKSHLLTRYELKKILKQLQRFRGRATELVSVYVPQGYPMREIISMMDSEQSEAQNIKSKSTRKNVISALEKIARRLRESPKTPENGVALFCGNVSGQEGRTDLQMYEVSPPDPISTRIYRCDKKFVLEPLQDQIEEKHAYGMITVDKNDAGVGFLQGKKLNVLFTLDSGVPGKTAAGGQSQGRYERIREGLLHSFLTETGEKAKEAFLEKMRHGELLGVIVGGPGHIKDRFVDDGYLHSELVQKVIGRINLNYAGEDGLHELVFKSQDILQEAEVMIEKRLIQGFLEHLKKGDGLSAYGHKAVLQALEMGAVDHVIISERFSMRYIKKKDEITGKEFDYFVKEGEEEKTVEENDEGGLVEVENEDIQDVIEEKAEAINAKVSVVSSDTIEGQQLIQLSGIAALLRYRIS